MGFFSSVTSAFNWVKGKASSAYNWVADKVSAGVDKAETVVAAIHQDARDLVGGAGGLVRDTEKAYVGVVGNIVNKSADTVQSIGHDAGGAVRDASNALGNLGMPLAIGAVALAAVMLMKK